MRTPKWFRPYLADLAPTDLNDLERAVYARELAEEAFPRHLRMVVRSFDETLRVAAKRHGVSAERMRRIILSVAQDIQRGVIRDARARGIRARIQSSRCWKWSRVSRAARLHQARANRDPKGGQDAHR